MKKYKRCCFFCGEYKDEWKFTVKEHGVYLMPCCDECYEDDKKQPLPGTKIIYNGKKGERDEERRAEGDGSAPLPGNQLKLFRG